MQTTTSWDDDAAPEPSLAAPAADQGEDSSDDEEPFVAHGAGSRLEDVDPIESFPALLVDLAPLALELPGASTVREAVLEQLAHDCMGKSAALMEQGFCWHVPRSESASRREVHQAANPEALMSVFQYPAESEGIKTFAMWRAVKRLTPWEPCNVFKEAVAEARRPLKWMADMAIELEDLAEREANLLNIREDARRFLEDALHEREATLEKMHLSHYETSEPLTHQDISNMLAHVDALDQRVADAEHYVEDAEGAEGGAAADGERSLIDILLDVVYQHHPMEPLPPGESWVVQQATIAEKKQSLRRRWQVFFGRLPVASDLTLKHAPPSNQGSAPASPQNSGKGRPRLRVPPPPGVSVGRGGSDGGPGSPRGSQNGSEHSRGSSAMGSPLAESPASPAAANHVARAEGPPVAQPSPDRDACGGFPITPDSPGGHSSAFSSEVSSPHGGHHGFFGFEHLRNPYAPTEAEEKAFREEEVRRAMAGESDPGSPSERDRPESLQHLEAPEDEDLSGETAPAGRDQLDQDCREKDRPAAAPEDEAVAGHEHSQPAEEQ